MFLCLLIIGLTGLLVMALPAFGRHGAGGHHQLGDGHGLPLPKLAGKLAPPGHALVQAGDRALVADHGADGLLRLLPSPRVIFSLLALYGAFGNVLTHVAHCSLALAALLALLPAVVVERLAVNTLWKTLVATQADPSAPLTTLLQCEATAVTPFRNGRGIVSVVKEGRLLQLSASLVEQPLAATVRVGDRLRIEDVDAKNERLTVSLIVA